LLQGTILDNLDPFKEKKIEEVCKVLEEVKLDGFVKDLDKGIETVVSENSGVFSVGQLYPNKVKGKVYVAEPRYCDDHSS